MAKVSLVVLLAREVHVIILIGLNFANTNIGIRLQIAVKMLRCVLRKYLCLLVTWNLNGIHQLHLIQCCLSWVWSLALFLIVVGLYNRNVIVIQINLRWMYVNHLNLPSRVFLDWHLLITRWFKPIFVCTLQVLTILHLQCLHAQTDWLWLLFECIWDLGVFPQRCLDYNIALVSTRLVIFFRVLVDHHRWVCSVCQEPHVLEIGYIDYCALSVLVPSWSFGDAILLLLNRWLTPLPIVLLDKVLQPEQILLYLELLTDFYG